MDDDPLELLEDESPGDDATPAWERRRRIMRWVSIVALFALTVPSVIGTVSVAQSTAVRACRLAVDTVASERTPSRVAFELTDLETLGWNCYAIVRGGEVRVALLGLIPGAPRLVDGTLT